ncbi:hypothetical protein BGZ54_005619 [Gamsiella multidivaricata]|nr:hypothetical protein BGZ54_005619 [Gamsiella multidivaricata]
MPQTLRISGQATVEVPVKGSNTNETFATKTGIKRLILEGDAALSARPQFLRRCPELQSLSLIGCSTSLLASTVDSIKECCPMIEELAFYTKHYSVDQIPKIACLLDACCQSSAPSESTPTQSPLLSRNDATPKECHGRVGLKKLLLLGVI